MADTTITLLTEDSATTVAAELNGEALWLAPSDVAQATGWTLTGAGFCRGAICIPIPPEQAHTVVRADGHVNFAALSRLHGQALVHDDSRAVWALDASAGVRRATRTSLEAPDFTLPDLSGRLHALHEHRGKKVLLASWASW